MLAMVSYLTDVPFQTPTTTVSVTERIDTHEQVDLHLRWTFSGGATSEDPVGGEARLVDGEKGQTADTYGLRGDDPPTTSEPFILDYNHLSPVAVTKYKVYRSNYQYPRSWTFEASTDNVNWVLLDSTYSVEDSLGAVTNDLSEDAEFNASENEYQYFRFKFTSTLSGFNVRLREIELFTSVRKVDKIKINDVVYSPFVPLGAIMMWSGKYPPATWVFCMGQGTINGIVVPDLRGRFIMGTTYDTHDTGEGAIDREVGDTGGEELVTLTDENLPAHKHTHLDYTLETHGGNQAEVDEEENEGRYINYRTGMSVQTFQNSAQTTGQQHLLVQNSPFDNRPPYYVLAFIMKVNV